MLYPLKLQPIYKERIWGGKKLKEFLHKDIPSDRIGESWEVACHKNGTCTVSNGFLKGKSLMEIIQSYGQEILGTSAKKEWFEKFPLLVKILDASDKLSVQVHPEDNYAFEYENGELGKTEMWYVIDAEPGAQLVYGVKPGVTKEQFEKGIANGTLENLLNFVDVKPGDVFFIPATTLHAIGKGLLIAEIQQNSDTTYRVCDWNRTDADGNPRELHVQKALDVANLTNMVGQEKTQGTVKAEGNNIRTLLVSCEYFTVEKIQIQKSSSEILNGDIFNVLMVIEGTGEIRYGRKESIKKESFKIGDSFLIPANMGNYSICGHCTVLKTYIPLT